MIIKVKITVYDGKVKINKERFVILKETNKSIKINNETIKKKDIGKISFLFESISIFIAYVFCNEKDIEKATYSLLNKAEIFFKNRERVANNGIRNIEIVKNKFLNRTKKNKSTKIQLKLINGGNIS